MGHNKGNQDRRNAYMHTAVPATLTDSMDASHTSLPQTSRVLFSRVEHSYDTGFFHDPNSGLEDPVFCGISHGASCSVSIQHV